MNSTFQVQEISKHHNGDVEVTLRQVYDHTTRQLNDSTNPDGEIVLTVTDKSDFFQSGQKYLVNFRSMAPVSPGAGYLVSGDPIDQAELTAYQKANPGASQADFVAYKNAQYPGKRPLVAGDGTSLNDPHRFDGLEQSQNQAADAAVYKDAQANSPATKAPGWGKVDKSK